MEAENVVLKQTNSSLNALHAAEERKLKEYESLLLNAEAVNESLYTNYNGLIEDYNQAVRSILTEYSYNYLLFLQYLLYETII